MKKLLISGLIYVSAFGASPDLYMGDWQGHIEVNGTTRPIAVYMVPYGNNWYEVKIVPDFYSRAPALFYLRGQIREEKALFVDAIPFEPTYVIGTTAQGVLVKASLWEGKLIDSSIGGTISGAISGRFSINKTKRSSPTLGAKPPAGAITLFDGSNLDEWIAVEPRGSKARWKIHPDGSMEVQGGNIMTKRVFRDHILHIEFCTPYMPNMRGQARGNSGVYILGRYEIQILDSYGLEGESNECGGIYQVAKPKVNMCLPPLEWQTYDITFTAPRFDEAGKKISNARITVIHNGIPIHEDVEIPAPTPGALDNNESTPGPLMLQDHGDPVRFRNIWIVEK